MDWIKQKRLKEGSLDYGYPDNGFKTNDENDYAFDHEHVEKELFKVLLTKYPEETIEFVSRIAQRGDQEVSSLLKKIKKQDNSCFGQPNHSIDKDEVVPSNADVGSGGDFGNE